MLNRVQRLYDAFKLFFPTIPITLEGPSGESELWYIDIGSTEKPPYIVVTWGDRLRCFTITIYDRNGVAHKVNQLSKETPSVYQYVEKLLNNECIKKPKNCSRVDSL